jgi:hypothetical protein
MYLKSLRIVETGFGKFNGWSLFISLVILLPEQPNTESFSANPIQRLGPDDSILSDANQATFVEKASSAGMSSLVLGDDRQALVLLSGHSNVD